MKPQGAETQVHTDSESSDADSTQRFERAVEQMLQAAPKEHSDMKVGAAPKRDTHSSGKGATGQTSK